VSFVAGVVALALVTALACALPGVFLLLRRDAMTVEAVSHAVLPGIVVGLLVAGSLDSPILILAAALTGLLVVLGAEYLQGTGLLEGDAPLGLVFPALFSIGIILVSLRFSNVHLDEHVVLVGDLNLAAFIHLEIVGASFGPRYLYVMLAVLLLNVAFIARFYKELKITTFDPTLAELLGFRVRRLHYAFMFLVSVTITAAFYAAGSILTVALMIVPAATAHLVTKRLSHMLAWTVAIAAVGALAGFGVAYALDAATSGAMALMLGLVFCAVFGGQRLQALWRARRRRRPDRVDAPAIAVPLGASHEAAKTTAATVAEPTSFAAR
jgi:manganese/zinc/iron transport system permease protein